MAEHTVQLVDMTTDIFFDSVQSYISRDGFLRNARADFSHRRSGWVGVLTSDWGNGDGIGSIAAQQVTPNRVTVEVFGFPWAADFWFFDCSAWLDCLAGNEGIPEKAAMTRRQREVAALAAAGLTRNEIAQKLMISPNTVKVHLAKAKKEGGVNPKTTQKSPF